MPPFPIFKGKQCRPFKTTSSDNFGPVFVKREEDEKGVMKRWVCIFTCLVTCNIYLEVFHDMTARSFLDCSRRFIALEKLTDDDLFR